MSTEAYPPLPACDEKRRRRDDPFGGASPEFLRRPRIRIMESVAAMLIVVFQLFFGWCDERSPESPAPEQCENPRDC